MSTKARKLMASIEKRQERDVVRHASSNNCPIESTQPTFGTAASTHRFSISWAAFGLQRPDLMWESDRSRVRLRVRFAVLRSSGADWETASMGIACFIFKHAIHEVLTRYRSRSLSLAVSFVHWTEFSWKPGRKNTLRCNWNELACYRITTASFCVPESFHCHGPHPPVDSPWPFAVSNERTNGATYVSLCKLPPTTFISNF